jgi:hypothetical protein
MRDCARAARDGPRRRSARRGAGGPRGGTCRSSCSRTGLLLRRIFAGLVDRREVLREHHAALELGRARVGAAREVDRSAMRPVVAPVPRDRRSVVGAGPPALAFEADGSSQQVTLACRDSELMRARLHDLPRGRREVREILRRVDRPLEDQRAAALVEHDGPMRIVVPDLGIGIEAGRDARVAHVQADAPSATSGERIETITMSRSG